MYLDICFHGGNCCGVKTLKNFHFSPTAVAPSLSKKPENNKDARGHAVSSSESFFTDEAPSETLEARLDRFLDFLKRRRPEGLVECYLVNRQVNAWDKVLKKRGFKADKSFKNSNSGNRITRYSLVMVKEPKTEAKETPLRQTTEMIDVEATA